jgi:hypothetical protein
MHEEDIQLLDLAALHLIRALDQHGEGLKPYLEANQIEVLRNDVVHLRRALLAAQMGPLYDPGWEVPVELLEGVPVREAAVRVAQIRSHTEPRGD